MPFLKEWLKDRAMSSLNSTQEDKKDIEGERKRGQRRTNLKQREKKKKL